MSRVLIVLTLVVALVVPILPSASVPSVSAQGQAGSAAATTVRSLGPGSRIPWQGENWYLNGANVAWRNWARDFGGGTGNGGVSAADSRAVLSERFGNAQLHGINTLRWWVFPGDAWQITRDGSGAPAGLDPAIYADFDAALELAEEHDLYYVFVLFSAPSHLPKSWLDDGRQRARLASALTPLFARYKDHPRVMTWEVFNEPDPDVWNNKVREDALRETIRAIADAVHANSHAYVTVGMSMLDGLYLVKGLGLDYYQAHWYDYMGSGNFCALCQDYETVRAREGLDAPLVIGELYVGPDTENPHGRLEDFYNKGYAGAWPWSLFPENTNADDKMVVNLGAMRVFAGNHPDLGPRAAPALAPVDPAEAIAPAAAAVPTGEFGFSSSALASPAQVGPGERVTVAVEITAQADTRALVDVEIYGPNGERVHQEIADNESFRAGQARAFTASWRVPATAQSGDYVVMVGLFRPGWGVVYNWNDATGGFAVTR